MTQPTCLDETRYTDSSAPCFVLTHPTTDGTMYTFWPEDDGVVIEFQSSRDLHTYVVPTGEARQLWQRLCRRGFTRF